MSVPNWILPLDAVLKHATEPKEMVSPKTGNTYTTDVILELKVFSTGSFSEKDGKFSYGVVDTVNQLEYTIKTENKIDVKFGNILLFKNVRGGMLNSGHGWYAADSVQVVQKNA